MSSVERHRGADTSTQAPSTSLESFDHLGPQGEFPDIHQPISGSTNFQVPHLDWWSNLIPFKFETNPDGWAFGSGLTHSDANVSTCDWPQRDIQPTTDGYPNSSWNRHCPPASLRTTPLNRRRQKLSCCDQCGEGGFTRSELRKHLHTHARSFKCDFEACSHNEEFTSRHDLDRHKRSVHMDWSVGGRMLFCPFDPCREQHKLWPRTDNFRRHLLRVHSKQHSASDSLTEYVHCLPPSSDLEGVGESVFAYMQGQNPQFGAVPLSELTRPSVLHGEESIHQVSWHLENHDALHQTSTSMSFDQFAPNLTYIQEGGGIYTPPTCLNTTALDNQTAALFFVSPSDLQPPNPIQQEFPGSGHNFSEAEPQGRTPSMSMEELSVDNELHTQVSTSQSSHNQEPHQSDIGMADAGDTVADTAVPREQVTEGSLSSNPEGVLQFLDWIPKHMIEAYLKRGDSLGPKNDLPGRDTFVDKNQNLPYKCQECGKKFARKSDLTKHFRRHSKPYGCTFPGCKKASGSKSDWMRHEMDQHWKLDRWKCDHLKPNSTEACGKVYHDQQTFKSHLAEQHSILDSGKIEEKLKFCQKRPNYDTSFWCGFCTEIIMVSEPQNGWVQRCGHIEDHFHGRGQPPMNIKEWEHEDPSEKEASSRPHEPEPDSPTESSNSDPKPRHGSGPNARPEQNNKAQSNATYMWKCCCCLGDNSFTTGAVCVNCDHRHCGCCEAFPVQPHDIA